MRTKIADIEKALDCGAYHAALALALTIPDICGIVQFGGDCPVWKRYINWYDSHIRLEKTLYDVLTDDSKVELEMKSMELNGKIIYELRCKFLHEGHADIYKTEKDKRKMPEYNPSIDDYQFELFTGEIDGAFLLTTRDIKQLNDASKVEITPHRTLCARINVATLCRNICSAATKYIDTKGEDAFKLHSLDIRSR